MDQFFESKWFLRILALLLSLTLFISVHNKELSSSNLGGLPIISNEEVVSDVPVNVYYDEQKYAVEGVPNAVSVTLEGANSLMATTKAKREFEVYVNLDGLSVGEHTVKLRYRNISDQLKVKIRPAQIRVTIQEKVMKNINVEVEFVNKDSLDNSFVIGKPQLDVEKVAVIGPLDLVENVASVKAKVDLKNIKSSFDGEVPLTAFDLSGNPVKVEIQPKTVNVFVPIGSVTKKVPVVARTTGILPEGYILESMDLSQTDVVIYGNESLVNLVKQVETKLIDLTGLTKTTTIRVPIVKKKGIEMVEPEAINVTLKIVKQSSKTFDNIPIGISNGDDRTVRWTRPTDNRISVTVSGSEDILKKIKSSDLDLSIDIDGLSDGSHEVKINVNEIPGVEITLEIVKAKINISS